MNKSLTKPLIRPLGGRWARVCLTALLTTVVTVGAQAQATCESGMQARTTGQGGAQAQATCESGTPSRTQMQARTAGPGGTQAQATCESGMQACTAGSGGAQDQATVESGTPSRTQMQTQTQTRACTTGPGGPQDRTAVEGGTPSRTACDIVLTPPRDLNSELRHRTWSVYTQGGLSWATGVWYRNLDAKRSYRQSAAAGGGFDLTIRPWVRVGAEYIWSRYRREQRLSALDAETMPVKAYGNYMMNLHNAKLGVGLNLMEMWPERRAQWLNIWAGTGAGYTFGRGNEYGIHFSSTQTQGGQTTPLTGGASISNDDAITITGNVRTTNRHERFNTFYIPASLHVEADLGRRLTVGLKGEADWLLNRGDIAPKGYAFALVTLRYNLVPSRAKVQRAYYEGEISALGGRLDALRLEADRSRARADEAGEALRLAETRNADLQGLLSDCEECRARAEAEASAAPPSHYVQFDHNSSHVGGAEAERLRAFARSVRGERLSLVAEASTPGGEDYNVRLSERRLRRVVEILVGEGLSAGDLRPATAIGARNGKPSAEGRRVTITVVKE